MFRSASKAAEANIGATSWTLDQVAQWLQSIQLADAEAVFRKERITGKALVELTDADLRELGLSLGERKIFIKEKEQLLAKSVTYFHE